jgi:hypothetical protein
MNAGSPETNVVVPGTALHRACIVCQLQRTPGWESHLFRSIIEWPKRMDLWAMLENILHDWENPDREAKARLFYEANLEAMNAWFARKKWQTPPCFDTPISPVSHDSSEKRPKALPKRGEKCVTVSHFDRVATAES